MRDFKYYTLTFLFALLIFKAYPQSKITELPEEAQKRLDYHIGEWSVHIEFLDSAGNVTRTAEGTDISRYLIDSTVVELTTIDDGNNISKGWIFYNIKEQKYYLVSVSSEGDLWILKGGLDQYVITSDPREQLNGKTVQIRFTHYNIEENSFEAIMEYTIDGGKTWRKAYRQIITRKT